jgi:hypothetical protein
MFVLDTFVGWVLKTVSTAAEAELNDDTALRDRLLEAEMRREMGDISDEDFADIERDILQRLREIKARREGGSGGALVSGAQPIEATADTRIRVDAGVAGEFHEAGGRPEAPSPKPHARRKIRR